MVVVISHAQIRVMEMLHVTIEIEQIERSALQVFISVISWESLANRLESVHANCVDTIAQTYKVVKRPVNLDVLEHLFYTLLGGMRNITGAGYGRSYH